MVLQFQFPERFDERVIRWCLKQWARSAAFDATMMVIGEWTPTVMLGLIGLAALGFALPPSLHRAAIWHGLAAVCVAVLARVINEPISKRVSRRRPFETFGFYPILSHDAGESFPSNHATGAFALATSFIGVPVYHEVLIVLACLLCVSRVYTGIHYVTDVVAGALHGTAVALFVCPFLLSFPHLLERL